MVRCTDRDRSLSLLMCREIQTAPDLVEKEGAPWGCTVGLQSTEAPSLVHYGPDGFGDGDDGGAEEHGPSGVHRRRVLEEGEGWIREEHG